MSAMNLLVPRLSPRLLYAADLCLRQIGGMDLRVRQFSPGDPLPEGPLLSYGLDIPGVPSLPAQGLLFQENVPDLRAEAKLRQDETGQVYRFGMPPAPGQVLAWDLLAAVFYGVTQWEQYTRQATGHTDTHGRPLPAPDESLQTQPWAHQAVHTLRKHLHAHFPALRWRERPFGYTLTFDIDQPWKYRHKPLAVNLGGLLRDVFSRPSAALQRLRTLTGGPDPWDTHASLRSLAAAEHLRIFFLHGDGFEKDSRFAFTLPPYQEIIRAAQAAGIPAGIHPSYRSSTEPGRIQAEKKLLEAVLGEPVTHSRQHYLRYQVPGTLRSLAAAGIQAEYSLCPVQYNGFAGGVCIPYRWFDLEKNAETALEIHPAQAMDRGLQQYQGLGPAAAEAEIMRLIAETKAVGGDFVLILHNETLSDQGEWKGWLPVIRKVAAALKTQV